MRRTWKAGLLEIVVVGLALGGFATGLVWTATTFAQEGAEPGVLPDLPKEKKATDPVDNGPTPEQRAEALRDADAAERGGLIDLNPKGTVRIDLKRKLVTVDGRISLREGQLEMFACPAGTKEHESVVAIDADAQSVHAGLLAIGARPGSVVKFDPEYRAAYGDIIEIYVLWKDDDGKPHRVRAQSWILDAKTNEELASDWVFAGSGIWVDPADGKRYYYGDGGDFICVSNFATATLDLPIESSQSNDALLFEAWTDRIPPRGTPVRLVLRSPPNPDYPKEVKQSPGSADAAPSPFDSPEEKAPSTETPEEEGAPKTAAAEEAPAAEAPSSDSESAEGESDPSSDDAVEEVPTEDAADAPAE